MKGLLLYLTLSSLLLACSGCSVFHSFSQEEKKQPIHTYLNKNRFNAITASGKFICLIDQERPPARQTIRDMIRIAEQSALAVEFRPIPHSLRIPALLRAGKGDIAIGNYTKADAIEKHLDFLTVRDAVCILRKDDPEWKELLASGAAFLTTPTPAAQKK